VAVDDGRIPGTCFIKPNPPALGAQVCNGAVRPWESLGFAVVGRLPGAFRHHRPGFVDALVMFKTLAR